ncbi:MAG: glycosyltransferase family 9 protein [Terriglobia bacterium]|jgi:ADP-heptose:LPS heptosyltransferase
MEPLRELRKVTRNALEAAHLLGAARKARQAACFLTATAPALTRANGLQALLGSVRRSGPMILFERYGGIGDVICSFPAVLALRDKFPGAPIVYAVAAPFIPIVRMGRVADAILPIYDDTRLVLPSACRLGFGVVIPAALTHERIAGGTPRHLVDDFCAQAGVTPKDRQPRLSVPRGLSERVLSELSVAPDEHKPLVAIHTGPTWRVKEWPDTGWRELVSWLLSEHHAQVIQLGSAEYRKGDGTRGARIEGAIDCVGRLSLEETAACIQACDLFVGVDSGPLHMAGAVGTPSVGLFGATDPALHLPPKTASIAVAGDVPCLGCQQRRPVLHWQDDCPMQIACMKALRVGQVAEACDRMLESGSGCPLRRLIQ